MLVSSVTHVVQLHVYPLEHHVIGAAGFGIIYFLYRSVSGASSSFGNVVWCNTAYYWRNLGNLSFLLAPSQSLYGFLCNYRSDIDISVRVGVVVTNLPLSSETVLVTFTTHGYSNVPTLSLTDFSTTDYNGNIIYPEIIDF